MLTERTIYYKGTGIEYDDFGFYTVQYCGDDVTFMTVAEAKKFIDEVATC